MLRLASTVRWVTCSALVYTRVLTGCNFKLWLFFQLVSTAPTFTGDTQHSTIASFLGFRLPGSWGCFSIDRPSHVSLRLRFLMIMFTNEVLIETASSAIWNRNKVAVGMAFSVWVINIGFLIQGMSRLLSLLLSMWGHATSIWQQVLHRWVINLNCFTSFPLSHPVAARGRLCITSHGNLLGENLS